MHFTGLIGKAFCLAACLVSTSAHAEALASFLADNSQFYVIGDPDHGSLPHYRFRASDDFISAVAAANVKMVFVEIPRKFQPLFDKVYDETMRADEFARVYFMRGARFTGVPSGDQADAALLTGEMAEKLARHKIRTIAFDTGGLIASDDGRPQDKLDPVYSCLAAKEANGRRGGDPLLEDYLAQAKWRERLAEDTLLANYIENEAGGDKSIILIGALHLATVYGLDHRMNAKSIVMFGIGELQTYAVWLHESANDLGLDANRLPNGFLDISNLEITSDIPELSQIKSAKGHWRGPCADEAAN